MCMCIYIYIYIYMYSGVLRAPSLGSSGGGLQRWVGRRELHVLVVGRGKDTVGSPKIPAPGSM